MRISKIFRRAVFITLAFTAVGCDKSPEEIAYQQQMQHERMLMQHELKMAQVNAGINFGYTNHPVAPGHYSNYMGNASYGRWDPSGHWAWNNPNSIQASQTANYLIAAGVGAMAMNTITRNNWTNDWSHRPKERTVKYYIDNTGGTITSAEYKKRNAVYQSEKKTKAADIKKIAAKKPVFKKKTIKAPVVSKKTIGVKKPVSPKVAAIGNMTKRAVAPVPRVRKVVQAIKKRRVAKKVVRKSTKKRKR